MGRLLFFAGMFGIVLIPILQTLSYPLLTLLGAVPENYVEAVEYFQVNLLFVLQGKWTTLDTL